VSSVLQPGRDVIAEQSEMSRVRELTISTKSQNFIRIYFIDKLQDADNQEGEQRSALKELEKLRGKLDTVKEQPYPVKHYPETTHKHMVEYYENLRQTLIDYHAYQLIDGQKPETISKVSANENK
jgi:hypothetical protein